MILKIILFFFTVYAVSGKHVKVSTLPKSAPLKWPTSYSVELRKFHMASSLIENFKYWTSCSKSRLETNDGAVIKITIGNELGKGYYEIHPETTEEENNKMVCVKYKRIPYSADFLPSVKYLKEQGTENVKGMDCIKFTNEEQSTKSSQETLWAYYDNSTEVWIPVRYKTKQIDDWHGYFKYYQIWDYINFEQDVNPDIFNVNYNCTTKETNFKGTKGKSISEHLLSNNEEKKLLKDALTIDDQIKKYEDLRREKSWKVGKIPFPYSETRIKEIAAKLPKEYDLRLEGFVGPVSDRVDCSSAWAFAVTAAVEGALARSNGGTWIKLSEQALMDCSWGYGNKGCTYGHPEESYQWIMEHGLPTEQKYGTYQNKNGFCKMENMTKTFKIKGYTFVTPFSVEALKIALIYHGPIVVRVSSMLSFWYDGGVYYEPACRNSPAHIDAFMTLVGYGEKDGDTFWILKESKGPYWGINGYIHVSARDNNCGVMTEPTYVVA